jgi:predicted RNase H-like HicB family nuclease
MNCKSEVMIYWSKEHEAFIAEAPELSGCMADGNSCAEALKNIEVIIAEWIETAKLTGKIILEPKGKLIHA